MSGFILVTGGMGYIGSHTVVKLLNKNFKVIVFDNLCNSNPLVLERIEQISGKRPLFIKGDIRNKFELKNIFKNYLINAVIHFAGLKSVGEGESKPLYYYDNNVVGSMMLFQEMFDAGVRNLIFSSSATVYGNADSALLSEKTPLSPISVYGRTKRIVEDVLQDLKKSQPAWNIAILRYFNPVGAHSSGLIGEDPTGIPNNLMPYISQVAVGKLEKLFIFGDDYPTKDGTGVRDYIHVEDLALAHIAALDKLMKKSENFYTVNIGTGHPYSVLDVVKTFEKISGKNVPYEIIERRLGDVATSYTDPTLAKTIFGWEAKYDINKMCEDTWRWQRNNPKGYVI